MISVIIPTRNESARIQETLQVLIRDPDFLEVLICDAGSRDGTLEIASAHSRVRFIPCARANRGFQMNRGAAAARGNILLFLHADTVLPQGWGRDIQGTLGFHPGGSSDAPSAAGPTRDFGAFPIRFDSSHPLLGVLSGLSRWAHPLACYGDQGVFCRAGFFRQVGPFPEEPLLEDVHWIRAAARLGRLGRARGQAVTSGRRFLARGVFRQFLVNTLIVLLDLLGVPAARLAPLYRGSDSLYVAPAAARPGGLTR